MTMHPPERLSLGDIFANRYPLQVPKYQRGYAWESEHVEDFITDLNRLAAETRHGNRQSHFLGGVVTIETPVPGSKTGRVYDLVDGQQRLATSFLALSRIIHAYKAVEDAARAANDEVTARRAASSYDVDSGQYLFYEEVDQATGDKRLRQRLQLSRADADYFRQLIDGLEVDIQRGSHELLRDASRNLQRKLVEPITRGPSSPAEKWVALQTLFSALKDDMELVHIGSDEREEAYRLFMTLNNRGRTLSEGELLRAWTLELLDRHEEQQQQVERDWDIILERDADFVERFMRDFFASWIGRRASRKNLFDEFRENFFKFPARPDPQQARQLASLVANIRREYSTYVLLAQGYWPFEEPNAGAWERDRLERLVTVLGRSVALPLLMAVYAGADESLFADVVGYVERADFRYLMSGLHAGQLGDRYYEHAKAARDAKAAGRSFDLDALRETVQRAGALATDDVFRAAVNARMRYGGQSKYLAHFLTTVAAYYVSARAGDRPPRADRVAVYDLRSLDVEHIYAQRPKVAIPELEPVKHELGNLSFWASDDNKAESNNPFEEKQARYAESAVSITRELGGLERWDLVALRARQDRLVDVAMKVFTFE